MSKKERQNERWIQIRIIDGNSEPLKTFVEECSPDKSELFYAKLTSALRDLLEAFGTGVSSFELENEEVKG